MLTPPTVNWLTFEMRARREWLDFPKEQRGVQILSYLVDPAFDDPSVWRLHIRYGSTEIGTLPPIEKAFWLKRTWKRTIDFERYKKHEDLQPVARPRYLESLTPTIESIEQVLDPEKVNTELRAIQGLRLPPMVAWDGMVTADGVTYTVTLENFQTSTVFRWNSDRPAEWVELRKQVETLLGLPSSV